MTPPDWSVEVEEYAGSGQISINEINRVIHDPDWADRDEWERDLNNTNGIAALRNAAPATLGLLKALLEERQVRIAHWQRQHHEIEIEFAAVNDALAAFVEGEDVAIQILRR